MPSRQTQCFPRKQLPDWSRPLSRHPTALWSQKCAWSIDGTNTVSMAERGCHSTAHPPNRTVELTRFRGHLNIWETGVHDGKVQSKQAVCCLLYTSPSPRDGLLSRMPSSA